MIYNILSLFDDIIDNMVLTDFTIGGYSMNLFEFVLFPALIGLGITIIWRIIH